MTPSKKTDQPSQNSWSFAEAMEQLSELTTWFQQDDIDLEQGLTKLKHGKDLIQKCQTRLASIENEFVEIKAEFDQLTTDATDKS